MDRTPSSPRNVPRPPTAAASVLPGLLAALTWGLATPGLKRAAGDLDPFLASGWMDASAGVALTLYLLARPSGRGGEALARADLPWLAGATLCGAVVGPYALVRGIDLAPAHAASLLLNLEVVASAGLAVLVFRERATWRRAAGALLVTAGGVAVAAASPPSSEGGHDAFAGAAWIALACVAWGVDNNLTRRIAHRDAPSLARAKLAAGGGLSLVLAAAAGAFSRPLPWGALAGVSVVGTVGVGVSLVLFVVSLRRVGVARTSVLFGTAPFVGAAASALLLGERFSPWALVAAAAMAAGVVLVATERQPERSPPR